jgi:hypothetical protein
VSRSGEGVQPQQLRDLTAAALRTRQFAQPEEGGIDLLSGRVAASRRMLAAFDVRAWRVRLAP